MAYGFMVEVWGEYALFTRPECKTERVSYDVITPSAARGLIEAVYWHPGLKYVIDRIYVLNEIEFTNVRRNEVASKISTETVKKVMNGTQNTLFLNTNGDRQQRAAMVVRNPHYIIEFHFKMTDKALETDSHGKFTDIIRRRLEKGQMYCQPYFGTREFPASFAPYAGGEIKTAYAGEGERDLGYMLFDMDYTDPADIKPIFFRAIMKDGVIDLIDCEVAT